ncbi:MAG: type II toxin-antitoxin system VapC family toxin [Actinomycetota bacterium]
MAVYVDTSAALKFVIDEPESTALTSWRLDEAPDLIASDLIRTELTRATRRLGADDAAATRRWLDTITLMPVTRTHFETAGMLDPIALRSLDALHLAAALDLGPDCDAFLTYDSRLADAARSHGLAVLAPD